MLARGAALVYDPLLAAAAVIHVLTGVMWIAVFSSIELIVLRDLANAKRLQDLGTMKNHAARLSKLATMLGLGTLITGLAYLFLKYGTNLSFLASYPPSRTILIAFGIVCVLLVVGIAVLRPKAAALGKRVATLDPAQPLPDDFLAAAKQLVEIARLQGVGLVVVLILMVLAVQGGI